MLLQDETINISSLLDDMNVSLIEQQTMLQHIASVARSAATSTVPIVVDIEQGILRVVQQVDDFSHVDDTIMILQDLAHGISCLPEVFHVDEVLNRVSWSLIFRPTPSGA